jgi:hypothetical protein
MRRTRDVVVLIFGFELLEPAFEDLPAWDDLALV